MGGAVDFSIMRGAKTLHIPCEQGGHIVDVKIRQNLDPNGTVRHMLATGWTIGRRKLKCPDCQPKKSPGRVAHMKRLNEARVGVEARLAKSRTSEEQSPMSEEQQPFIVATPAAGHAKRLIYLALEDAYDEVAKRYKTGYSDASIAAEVGMAEALVKTIREESYGPLGEPPELTTLRGELTRAMGTLGQVRAAANACGTEVERIRLRMESICSKHGWAM